MGHVDKLERPQTGVLLYRKGLIDVTYSYVLRCSFSKKKKKKKRILHVCHVWELYIKLMLNNEPNGNKGWFVLDTSITDCCSRNNIIG